ncbi:hypothetical protein NDU88_003036 [Pleurodeles waltl]|uniref:Uncharacterized protein n=1 Tax=Pleurodeles waltl TaxID=8319 RepID=A0AAV7TMB4_PLEWA|nr:hypothetical protein NDU88_003036 [Pleurodeles waltl]
MKAWKWVRTRVWVQLISSPTRCVRQLRLLSRHPGSKAKLSRVSPASQDSSGHSRPPHGARTPLLPSWAGVLQAPCEGEGRREGSRAPATPDVRREVLPLSRAAQSCEAVALPRVVGLHVVTTLLGHSGENVNTPHSLGAPGVANLQHSLRRW